MPITLYIGVVFPCFRSLSFCSWWFWTKLTFPLLSNPVLEYLYMFHHVQNLNNIPPLFSVYTCMICCVIVNGSRHQLVHALPALISFCHQPGCFLTFRQQVRRWTIGICPPRLTSHYHHWMGHLTVCQPLLPVQRTQYPQTMRLPLYSRPTLQQKILERSWQTQPSNQICLVIELANQINRLIELVNQINCLIELPNQINRLIDLANQINRTIQLAN